MSTGRGGESQPDLITNHLIVQDVTPAVVHALGLVGAVHGLPPDAPVVTVAMEELVSRGGQYGTALDGRLFIVVDLRAAIPGFIVAHEFGHFLNERVLSAPGGNAAADAPLLEEWRQAVQHSAAVQHLQAQADQVQRLLVTGELSGQELHDHIMLQQVVLYRLRPQELFSRSYAQYVAQETGDAMLSAELGALLTRTRASGVQLPLQWERQDFKTIASTLDQALRRAGLR